QHLPLADASALIQAYETAFDRLLVVLATITLLTAIVVFLGLRRGSSPERDAAPLPAGQEG
ncbi:MFS transporter, partial [Mesorhizobium sp. M4B.F.Ca.ET.211.01.1.1]